MLYAGYKLMEHLKIPKNYASALSLHDTQVGIKTVKDFFQNLLTDQFLLFSKFQLTHKFLQIFYRKRSHFINIAISYRHRQRFFF